MDHLLSRVGFHPTLTTIKAYLLQGNSQWISRNSLAAYHALNVASNVIFYYFLFCSSLFSFTCFTCGMSHLFRSEYWDTWVAIKNFILTRGILHGNIWFHGSRRIVAVMRLKIISESEGIHDRWICLHVPEILLTAYSWISCGDVNIVRFMLPLTHSSDRRFCDSQTHPSNPYF